MRVNGHVEQQEKVVSWARPSTILYHSIDVRKKVEKSVEILDLPLARSLIYHSLCLLFARFFTFIIHKSTIFLELLFIQLFLSLSFSLSFSLSLQPWRGSHCNAVCPNFSQFTFSAQQPSKSDKCTSIKQVSSQ